MPDSLDDENINPKDLQLNGVVDLIMKDGRHYTLDDPGQTVVIQGKGSISVVTNSPARMEELRTFQQAALASYAAAHNANPTSTGGSGSSAPSDAVKPIKFAVADFQPILVNLVAAAPAKGSSGGGGTATSDHQNIPPSVSITNNFFHEIGELDQRLPITGSSELHTVTGTITFAISTGAIIRPRRRTLIRSSIMMLTVTSSLGEMSSLRPMSSLLGARSFQMAMATTVL